MNALHEYGKIQSWNPFFVLSRRQWVITDVPKSGQMNLFAWVFLSTYRYESTASTECVRRRCIYLLGWRMIIYDYSHRIAALRYLCPLYIAKRNINAPPPGTKDPRFSLLPSSKHVWYVRIRLCQAEKKVAHAYTKKWGREITLRGFDKFGNKKLRGLWQPELKRYHEIQRWIDSILSLCWFGEFLPLFLLFRYAEGEKEIFITPNRGECRRWQNGPLSPATPLDIKKLLPPLSLCNISLQMRGKNLFSPWWFPARKQAKTDRTAEKSLLGLTFWSLSPEMQSVSFEFLSFLGESMVGQIFLFLSLQP